LEKTIEDFFHDFRQELLAGSESKGSFHLSEFMETVASELIETGFTEGFELCHFKAQRGMRVDGYWFNDEGALDLFIADFDSRSSLSSLTKTEVDAYFKRVSNFFEASLLKELVNLEVTSPEYGLARQIADRKASITRLNLILFSERALSERIQAITNSLVAGTPASYHVWDISRIYRHRTSVGHKEPLDMDFQELFGAGISCLPAHLGSDSYQSYLIVMPAQYLATLYERFGARLLEQNVRTFLQARGSVNQGIRATILNEPEMFFAYNNGITATAESVTTKVVDSSLVITRIVDLQIVNGGQTTASLFHTRKRDKADLLQIFVQMKLTVINNEQIEIVVPKISEYANTQNRVNAADFFSNHPFHVRMEGFSRRLWAPAHQGSQRETKWFYERARGQYADAQTKLTPADTRRFKAEYPKIQMFTKTDLAKFDNVWDDHPKWVNLGSQKNFARYAGRIGSEWEKSSDYFNEIFFKRAVARGLIFRAAERTISAQPWYNGGYRANIVAYTIALIGEITKKRQESINFLSIWGAQYVSNNIINAIAIIAAEVAKDINNPLGGIANISEWCKKEACWTRIQARSEEISKLLPEVFFDELISTDDDYSRNKTAKQTQRIDTGIEAQRKVLTISAEEWRRVRKFLQEKGLITPKEDGVLGIGTQIPAKLPSDKQSIIMLELLGKANSEGFQ